MDKTMGTSKTKLSAAKVKNCMRTFLVHLFSHVGLCVLVVGYAVAGGFLFESIESTYENELIEEQQLNWTTEFNGCRRNLALMLWNITERLNVLHEGNWTKEVERELDLFGHFIVDRVKDNKQIIGISKQWTFPQALLYSVSIITTIVVSWDFVTFLIIRYGNTAPQTMTGKILTMFYALIGVPLMLMWVSNIGNLMANTFKFAYAHGPCCSSSTNSNKSSKKSNTNKSSNNPTVQTSSFSRQGSQKGQKSLGHGPGMTEQASATQVQYSLNERKCETRLLEPSHKVRRKLHRGSEGSSTIQGLTAGAKQVLLECAEYNVSQGGGMDERSRRVLEQLQNNTQNEHQLFQPSEGSIMFPPLDEEDSPEHSEVESVIDLHATMLGGHRSALEEDDEEAVHSALDCYPYPPCPYPFYDTTLSSAPTGGGILRKPSVTGSVKKTVSLIESCPSVYGTPSKIPLISREETCPDLVDIERFSIDSVSGGGGTNEKGDERVPTTVVLSIVVIYILAGAGAFSYLERWGFYDSAYFCFITLSTIGLGDLTPAQSLKIDGLTSIWTSVRLVFCCLYLVLGLAIIAMSFNLVQEDLTLKTKNMARRLGIIRSDDD